MFEPFFFSLPGTWYHIYVCMYDMSGVNRPRTFNIAAAAVAAAFRRATKGSLPCVCLEDASSELMLLLLVWKYKIITIALECVETTAVRRLL